jgi:Fur family zinc uptake transcriptional regulator
MSTRDPLPRNQALVLGALRDAPGRALTAYELLARLHPAGMRGPQTVYRALEGLQRARLIHRIESLNAFTACTHAHAAHEQAAQDHDHHAHRPAFAVCRECGAVRELDDPALSAVLGVVADRSGFAVRDRVIELVGACGSCATPTS